MGTSLKDLRQALGEDLGECFVGTVDSATATSITDAELADPDEESTKYEGNWLKVVGGEVRRIRSTEGYVPADGRIAWARSLTDVPGVGDEYEIHSLMSAEVLDRLINNGLARCYYTDRQSITVVADQREYALAEYTWITRREQVVNVRAVVGDTALQKRYVSLPWFEVTEDAGVLTLHIDPISYDEMVLLAFRPYEALASDTAETNCPLEWAKAAALMEIYRWLARPGPAEDNARYGQEWARAAAAFAAKSRVYAPRQTIRVQRMR